MIPSYEDIDGADPFRDPHLFVKLSQLSRLNYRNLNSIAQHANYGMIPGRVPLQALSFSEWDLN